MFFKRKYLQAWCSYVVEKNRVVPNEYYTHRLQQKALMAF